MILIGTDEAGYGPNIGPLLITATAWRCGVDIDSIDLENFLKPLGENKDPKLRMPVADSKRLFSSSRGIRQVEQSLYTFLSLQNNASQKNLPSNWNQLWKQLAGDSMEQFEELPWYQDLELNVPQSLPLAELGALVNVASQFFQQSPVDFLTAQSTALEPRSFNAMCKEQGDNKSSLLTFATLNLFKKTIDRLPAEPAVILCDKHGGRNRYMPALQSLFPDQFIQVVTEGKDLSLYRTVYRDVDVEIRFIVKGERYFPVALASMFSKYLRELAMGAFNQFWRTHLPQLQPTAGYPVDAKRFRVDIHSVAKRLQVDERLYWRTK